MNREFDRPGYTNAEAERVARAQLLAGTKAVDEVLNDGTAFHLCEASLSNESSSGPEATQRHSNDDNDPEVRAVVAANEAAARNRYGMFNSVSTFRVPHPDQALD